jgi:serine/threonine protein kinase/WD40 repeat protein
MSDKPSIDSIFCSAIDIESSDERRALVEQACGEDVDLRHQVERLLHAHFHGRSILDAPVQPLATVDASSASEAPGSVLGPYKLLEQIGEGGFGVVFMAEQTRPVRRKVALKVLKAGMDTRQVVARFEAERQALALMDHPNIAQVFDGGETAGGRPYFVMELVRGIPMTEFCDEQQLPVRQRLELFVSVCRAVQHAHQKGIIHRDLKPSNIMVTLHDGTPVVKVIDFGIAKALGRQLTDKTLFTNFAQLMGTPTYMSPEQAQLSGLDMDTRTDIYSLGVLLYELLTSTTPCDKERLRTAAYDEIRRIIREEEPARPSLRVNTLGQASTPMSANRRSDPARLSQLFRGELDWIVMRALEKDRNRRYETASAFAADVERYLKDEQVLACPPSAGYRLRKLVRRNKGLVLAVSLVMLVLLGGIIGTTWGMLRATDAEADAVQAAGQKDTALREKDGAFKAAQASARDAQEQLLLALQNQARAERVSGRPGQRFAALRAIRKAAQIRVTPELRTEAIAALTLPDLEIAQEWDGYPEGTIALAFDADFQQFARLSRTGSVTICRRRDNGEEVIAKLPAAGKPPYSRVWMSPDGRFVAYGHSFVQNGKTAGVCVWKLDGPEPALLFDVPEGLQGNALAFRPNSRQLAIGHFPTGVSVYDLATGEPVQRLAKAVAAVNLAFHPRDNRLAVAGAEAGVRLFDVDTGAHLLAPRPPPGVTYTYSVAWHPDGRRLAAGCNDRKIHLWDTETGTEVMPPWVGNATDGSLVAFNRDGDRLGSIDWTGLAQVWDVATGRLLLAAPVFYWQFSPTDQLHGYGISGTKVKLWRLAAGRELRVLRRRNADSLERIHSPVVHADGRILAATAEGDQTWLSFFDLRAGEELASVKLAPVDSPICFHESVGWITSGPTGLLQWPAGFDLARPDMLRVGPAATVSPGLGAYKARGAGASADGGVLAVPDGTFTTLIHRARPAERLKLGPQHDVRFAAVSPDGRWVATCSWFSDGRSKSTRIWDADSGEQVHELPLEGSTIARFSPDGRWLVTYNWSAPQLWEVGTWQPGRRFDGLTLFNPDIFSPKGRLVAIGGVFGVVRLVDTETGKEIARFTGPEPTHYTPLCFTPDGTGLIATGADQKTLHVWDLRAIRQQLKAMDLDWEWPEFGPAEPKVQAPKFVRVEVLTSDLQLTREQKARQAIERYLHEVKVNPDNASACNALAWVYLTGPTELRDVKAAVPLAEKAMRLAKGIASYRNTLGLAYYRAARYREAVDTLRPNLDQRQDTKFLAFDLYFLAMSYHGLGESEQAREYLAWAVRWTKVQRDLPAANVEELREFRAEAEELLETKKGPRSEK